MHPGFAIFFWTPEWLPLGAIIRRENLDIAGMFYEYVDPLIRYDEDPICPPRFFETKWFEPSIANLDKIINSRWNSDGLIPSDIDDPLVPPCGIVFIRDLENDIDDIRLGVGYCHADIIRIYHQTRYYNMIR